MAKGCARPRSTGKPLQIAVDDVPGTTEATPGGFNRAIGGDDDQVRTVQQCDTLT
jgi:hypothetical protein